MTVDTETAAARDYVRRSCSDREVRDVVLRAIKGGARAKRTRKGVMLFGPGGMAVAHMTESDHRAARNLAARVRRLGLTA